jgi:hypothetical protein
MKWVAATAVTSILAGIAGLMVALTLGGRELVQRHLSGI